MRSIWMVWRAEVRARWRTWIALAVVFGLGSGGAIAAAAGARRTDTAYPRFIRAQNAFDAVSGGGGYRGFGPRFAALKNHRLVEDFVEIVTVGGEMTIPARRGRGQRTVSFPDMFVGTDVDGRALYEINRAKVLDGRLADRKRLDEVMVPFSAAKRFGLEVGDKIIVGVGFDVENAGPNGFPPPLARLPARVVGITAAQGDFEAIGQTLFLGIYVTPAVYQKHRDSLPIPGGERDIDRFAPDVWSLGFKVKGSAVAFKQAVEHDLNIDVPIIEPVVSSGVQKTIRLYTAALWLLGALVAVATLAVVGQTLARQHALESADYPTFRAMGVSRRQLFGLGLLRAMFVAALATAVAAVVAYLASPLTPIGPARTAEPAPGLAFDATAIGIGCALVVLLVPLITLIPSLRAARAAGEPERAVDSRPSWLVRNAARVAASPATAAGLRMALEPGRGRTAVPVRSTIIAVAFGIAAVTASVTVGRSLTHLLDTPALTGFTYDAILPGGQEFEDPPTPEQLVAYNADRVSRLEKLPFIDRLSFGTALNVIIGGADAFVLAFSEDGDIGYALIDGRRPSDATQGKLPEIAIGAGTMRRMHLRIGGTVELEYPNPEQLEEELEGGVFIRDNLTQRAVIVGVAAIPPVPWAATEPGEGAVMTAGTVKKFNLGDPAGCCFVSFKPGTDLRAAATKLDDAGFEVSLRTKRADMATLERVSQLPVVLSVMFALIAAAALAHVLVTAVRRRRRDLAILKTLGFTKQQVRRAIAWQVSTIAVLSLVVGIPIGIIIGRWGWRLIAAQFGVVPVVLAPAALIVLLLPIALLLGNLVAALPGRSAARTKPALVLRAE